MSATSSTTSFSIDVDDLIHQASNYVGGEPTSGQEANQMTMELMMLLLDLQNRSVPLAKRTYHNGLTFSSVDQPYVVLPAAVDDVASMKLVDGTRITPLKRIALDKYDDTQIYTTPSKPVAYAVDRQENEVRVYFYPHNNKSTYTFNAVTFDKIEDVTALAQGIDIAPKFYPALLAGLAARIGNLRPDLCDINRRMELKADFEQALKFAFNNDRQRVPVRLKRFPHFGRR